VREWHILYTGRLDRRVLVRERPWNVVWLFAAECVVLGILWARTGLLYGNGRDLAVSGLGAERGLGGGRRFGSEKLRGSGCRRSGRVVQFGGAVGVQVVL